MKPGVKSIRKEFEKREDSFLSPHGCRSADSRGRLTAEPACPVRTGFQLDRDRIIYCNAFRRLKHKTQVFLTPLGDEYRTRLTHTLEVAAISRSITRALFLNEDLAEAIALGHDLGHTPFGHSGETALKEIFSPDFSHNEQSLRVVELLENDGRGLNLTYEVRDGILKHSKGFGPIMPETLNELPITIEGCIVRIADMIGYLYHDLDDAIRSRVIRADQLPRICVRVMGEAHQNRVTRMIKDIIFTTTRNGGMQLGISDDMAQAMLTMRKFLYDHVYRSPYVHGEFVKSKKIVTELFAALMADEKLLTQELENMQLTNCHAAYPDKKRTVCDLIASMTDRYALNLYRKIFFPSPVV